MTRQKSKEGVHVHIDVGFSLYGQRWRESSSTPDSFLSRKRNLRMRLSSNLFFKSIQHNSLFGAKNHFDRERCYIHPSCV